MWTKLIPRGEHELWWKLVSIEAVDRDRFYQDDVDSDGEAELQEYREDVDWLTDSSSDLLDDALPKGYSLLTEYGDYSYDITLRCSYDGQEFPLVIRCHDEIEECGMDENIIHTWVDIDRKSQITHWLEHYRDEIAMAMEN